MDGSRKEENTSHPNDQYSISYQTSTTKHPRHTISLSDISFSCVIGDDDFIGSMKKEEKKGLEEDGLLQSI